MEKTGKSRLEERLYYACFKLHHKCVEHIVGNRTEYILQSTAHLCSKLPEWLIRNNGFRALRILFRSGLKMERIPHDICREDLGTDVQVAQVLFAQGVLPERDADPKEISLAAMCKKTIRYQVMIQADNDDLNAAVQQLPLPGRIKAQLEGPTAANKCQETCQNRAYGTHVSQRTSPVCHQRNVHVSRRRPTPIHMPTNSCTPSHRPTPTDSQNLSIVHMPERRYVLVPRIDDSDSQSEEAQ